MVTFSQFMESAISRHYLVPDIVHYGDRKEPYLFAFAAEKAISNHKTRTGVTQVHDFDSGLPAGHRLMGYYGKSLDEQAPTIVSMDRIILGAEIAKRAGIRLDPQRHDYQLPDDMKNPALITQIEKMKRSEPDLGDATDIFAQHSLGGYQPDDYGMWSNRR